MTTNHKEKLDAALLRPGRADVHVQLNNASVVQMENIFLRFFPNCKEQAVEFGKHLPEFKLSMAKLQSHCLKYRDKPNEAVKNTQELSETISSIEEMTVIEWLRRLNLDHHAIKFTEKKVFFVGDLRLFKDEG